MTRTGCKTAHVAHSSGCKNQNLADTFLLTLPALSGRKCATSSQTWAVQGQPHKPADTRTRAAVGRHHQATRKRAAETKGFAMPWWQPCASERVEMVLVTQLVKSPAQCVFCWPNDCMASRLLWPYSSPNASNWAVSL